MDVSSRGVRGPSRGPPRGWKVNEYRGRDGRLAPGTENEIPVPGLSHAVAPLPAGSRVPAVSRAVALLDAVSVSPQGRTLSELAREVRAPKSSVLNICEALVAERLLRKDADGTYRLGFRIAEWTGAQLSHPPRLRKVGLVVQNFVNPFFRAEADAIACAAKAMDIEVSVFDAGQALDQQQDQLKRLAKADVDAVILDPVDSDGVAEGVAAVRAQGIPVVAVNAGATGADATVVTDNIQAGELIGRYLAATLRGAGDVVVIGGTRITGNVDRISGFLSALRDYPGISVIERADGDNTRETGREVARALLDRHPQIEAVFSINDPTALGVVDALEARGTSALVLCVDGSAAALRLLREGRGIVATAAQDPRELGRAALEMADLLYSGSRSPRRTWLMPTMLVVRANADSYTPWDEPTG
jgi:ribose transport system substrate-binding protein